MFNFILFAGGDEFLEAAGRIGRLQRFGLKLTLMAPKYTPRDIRCTLRAKNSERRRGASGETLSGDLVDGAHADNADKTENLSAQRYAVHQAEISRGHDVSQFSAGTGGRSRARIQERGLTIRGSHGAVHRRREPDVQVVLR